MALQQQQQQQQQQERLAYEQHVKQMQMIQQKQQQMHMQQQQHQPHHGQPSPQSSLPMFAQTPHLTSPSSGLFAMSPPSVLPSAVPKADYPSFSVCQSHPRIATVLVKSQNFDPLRIWMPWIEWDGCWLESFPLQTTFRVPAVLLEESVRALMTRGFYAQQSRLAARM